jgi:hypothetical protein
MVRNDARLANPVTQAKVEQLLDRTNPDKAVIRRKLGVREAIERRRP